MTERTPEFDAAVEAYEAAQSDLMHLIDNPDKTVSVAEYIAKLEVAHNTKQAMHTAMMEAWG